MANMFYTFDETAAILGKSQEEIIQLVENDQLCEFREGLHVKFTVAQVKLLKQNLAAVQRTQADSATLEARKTQIREDRRTRYKGGYRNHSNTGEVFGGLFMVGLILLILVGGILFIWNIGSGTADSQTRYENSVMHEKAQVMREAGVEGTDRSLSNAADAIKKFNDQEKQRQERKKRILGE